MGRLLALCIAAALAGCVTISSSSIGTFAGILPCADCAGILSELHLYAEQPSGRPTHYELVETFLGTVEGNRSIGTTGPWTRLRGSASDADAVVIQIDLGRLDAFKNFVRVGDSELRLVDRNRKEIFSATPHSLHRVSELPPVTLLESDAERTFEVDPGQRVYAVLGTNRSTGDEWALDTSGGVLARLGDPVYVRETGALGGGGTAFWFFVAKGSGKQELRFHYRRAQDRGSPPAKTVRYVVVAR